MPAWLNRLGPIAAWLLRRPTSGVDDAGDSLAYAATAALDSGTLLADTGADEPPAAATNPILRKRLWELLEALANPDTKS